MTLLLQFLVAHFLGDFVFQPAKWVRSKEEKKFKSKFLYAHIFVHFLALVLVFQGDFQYWRSMLIVLVSHYFIDLGKLYLKGKMEEKPLFFLDQIAHLSVIVLVSYSIQPFLNFDNLGLDTKDWLLLSALLAVSAVSSVIIRVLMSSWNVETASDQDAAPLSLPNAGMYIGILERLFAFTFIVLGEWQAIGFLIAAKSVFRFSDLTRAKDRKLTEYILIGTLLSFALAVFFGLLYLQVLDGIEQ